MNSSIFQEKPQEPDGNSKEEDENQQKEGDGEVEAEEILRMTIALQARQDERGGLTAESLDEHNSVLSKKTGNRDGNRGSGGFRPLVRLDSKTKTEGTGKASLDDTFKELPTIDIDTVVKGKPLSDWHDLMGRGWDGCHTTTSIGLHKASASECILLQPPQDMNVEKDKWNTSVGQLSQQWQKLHKTLCGEDKTTDQELKSAVTAVKKGIPSKVKKAGLDAKDEKGKAFKAVVQGLADVIDKVKTFRATTTNMKGGPKENADAVQKEIKKVADAWGVFYVEPKIFFVSCPQLWVHAWVSACLSCFTQI